MKIFTAMIVRDPENCPDLLLAKTEAELLTKLKAELTWLDMIDETRTVDDVVQLYAVYGTDNYPDAYIFTGTQDLT